MSLLSSAIKPARLKGTALIATVPPEWDAVAVYYKTMEVNGSRAAAAGIRGVPYRKGGKSRDCVVGNLAF